MTISRHIFQNGRALQVSNGTNTVSFHSDTNNEIAPNVFTSIEFSPVFKKFTSDISGRTLLKRLGYSIKIIAEINVVNDTTLNKLYNLFTLINESDVDGLTVISDFKVNDTDNYPISNCYLSGEITPDYLDKSLMIGEKIELEFESAVLINHIPTFNIDYDRIIVTQGEIVITSGDNPYNIKVN